MKNKKNIELKLENFINKAGNLEEIVGEVKQTVNNAKDDVVKSEKLFKKLFNMKK